MPDIKILEQCKSISSTLETLRNEASRPHASVTLIGHNSNFRERLDAVKKSIRELKSSTVAYDSSDITHIEKVKSDFSTTIQVFRELEASFRVDSRETVKRQLRIINPNVSSAEIEAEIEAAIQNAETPIFQQALQYPDRRAQASSAYRNALNRHEDIEYLASQMEEVAELFKDMDQAVSQEEPVVRKVDESSEQVYSNMVEGGSELGKAVAIGRSYKRKKWWCVLILVLVIVSTIVVAVVVTLVVRKSKST